MHVSTSLNFLAGTVRFETDDSANTANSVTNDEEEAFKPSKHVPFLDHEADIAIFDQCICCHGRPLL